MWELEILRDLDVGLGRRGSLRRGLRRGPLAPLAALLLLVILLVDAVTLARVSLISGLLLLLLRRILLLLLLLLAREICADALGLLLGRGRGREIRIGVGGLLFLGRVVLLRLVRWGEAG